MGRFNKFLFSLLIKEEDMNLANAEDKRVIEMYKGGYWPGKCLVVKQ